MSEHSYRRPASSSEDQPHPTFRICRRSWVRCDAVYALLSHQAVARLGVRGGKGKKAECSVGEARLGIGNFNGLATEPGKTAMLHLLEFILSPTFQVITFQRYSRPGV